MENTEKKDYHDYVFKDNKLVGKFDDMYRDCPDPWLQSKRSAELEIKILLNFIQGLRFDRILELGCGLGHIAHELSNFGSVLGLDISDTAIQKAKSTYQGIEFDICDIREGIASRSGNKAGRHELFDLIVLTGTLWYVVDFIDAVFRDIGNHLAPRGNFLLSLPYPPLTKPFYGSNILPNEYSLINKVKEYFSSKDSVILRHEFKSDSPIVITFATKNS